MTPPRLARGEAPKPCPFCGKPPEAKTSQWGVHFINCKTGGCVGPMAKSLASMAAARRRWNRRAHV